MQAKINKKTLEERGAERKEGRIGQEKGGETEGRSREMLPDLA